MTAETQRANVKIAASALASIVLEGHRLVITHGNGPQVGLLALQNLAYRAAEAYPLDVLGSETEGMIGYLVGQELRNALPPTAQIATLLTQVEVSETDPAFAAPSKPIGPIYGEAEAEILARDKGWSIAAEEAGCRRVVPSPQPQQILELPVIEQLLRAEITVICAGGGGIPVVRDEHGAFHGTEAVIDKDLTSALLAQQLNADYLLLLTDVDGVYQHWGTPGKRRIRCAAPGALWGMTFEAGSMAPKIEAACAFASAGHGTAVIGALSDALAMLHDRAGTSISSRHEELVFDRAEQPRRARQRG